MPSTSAAARTSAVMGTAASSSTMPTPAFDAISWSVEARPPRVGSFMATTSAPPARSASRTSPLSGATSERRSPSSRSAWRRVMMAKPWAPTGPVTMSRSPGRSPASLTTRSARATPAVLRTMPSSSPLPITLVSPATTGAPASRLAARIESRMRRRSGRGNPSSITTAQVSPSGSVAPIMARSLTVPDTASRPMSPPGKKMGWTTGESVVMTRKRSPPRRPAPSSRAERPMPSTGCASARNTSSMSERMARPPAPCFRATRSVMARPRRRRGRRGAASGRVSPSRPHLAQVGQPPVLVPDLAGALGGAHAGPHRRLRPALLAEELAVPGRPEPGHDEPAEALLGEQVLLRPADAGDVDVEAPARVHGGPLRPQVQIPARHAGDAAPHPVGDLERLPQLLLRRAVALPGDAARVAVGHLGPAGPDELDALQDGRQDVERLEAGHHHRGPGPRREGLEDAPAGDGGGVAGGDEALDVGLLHLGHHLHGRRHVLVRREDGEVPRQAREHHRRGGHCGGLEAAGEEDHRRGRVPLRDL